MKGRVATGLQISALPLYIVGVAVMTALCFCAIPKGQRISSRFFSIWDAQGQIRFGGSCSSYVESAHGVRVAPNPSLPQRAAAEAAQFDMRR
jgi:hypothetical protein